MSWPDATFVEANGIRLAVYETGSRSDRPPVVLVHGFPELAYSWRHQIPALADAGFHVLAPDMRGYGLSDCPGALDAYDIAHLTGDLCGLLTAYGYDKAVFAGHDWGGLVTWAMPVFHPGQVAGNIGVNTPFQPRWEIDPIALYRKVFGDQMYIVLFQEPSLADAAFDADPLRTMRFFMRKVRASQPQDGGPALGMLESLADETSWPGEALLSDEDYQIYADAFARTGFTPAINWYRNMSRNWHLSEGLTDRVTTPALQICAADDLFLPPRLAEPMKAHCDDLEMALIDDCGHWTMVEQPERLNNLMISWLTRRFG